MKHEPIALTWVDRPRDWLMLVAVTAAACFVILYRLGDPAVYWWDEARTAVNSLEMLQRPGLVVTFRGEPDLWNTKPPLAVWLNALSMALFGVNEWALRLPSALAAIGTIVAVAVFVRRHSDNLTGLLAALILLGCGGFVEVHVARTADADSLLVLFVTLTVICLAERRWWLAGLAFGVALMTKGVAALLIVPGFLILGRDLRHFALPAACAVSVFLAFLGIRELVGPGYLAAAYLHDASRFGMPADGHSGSPLFYLSGLVMPWQFILAQPMTEVPYARSAFPWLFVAPLALLSPRSRAVPLIAASLLSLLLFLSIAATKLSWYAAPAYPLIALLAALGLRNFAWAALPFAALFAGLNVWKIEKELGTTMTSIEQRQPNMVKAGRPIGTPEFTWQTPKVVNGKVVGQETYYGPLEFYRRR